MQGAGRRVQGAGCRVQGAGCRVQGAGCRVLTRTHSRYQLATQPRLALGAGRTPCRPACLSLPPPSITSHLGHLGTLHHESELGLTCRGMLLKPQGWDGGGGGRGW